MERDHQNLKDPIFICGEGRSGTKLLRDTLSRHSSINIFRCETYIFVKSKIHRIKNLSRAEKSKDLDYLIKSVFACLISKNKNEAASLIKSKDFGVDIELLCSELKKNYELKHNSLDIFDKAAHLLTVKNNKKRWLEKTPFHIYYLEEITSKYPNARIILTVRDPKAVYASWKKRDKDKSLIGVAKSWNKVAQEILNAKEKYPNVFLIKFEDLVSSPKEKLSELCSFIDEEFEESLLDAQVVNSNFDENKKIGFDKSIINRWERQLKKKEIRLIDDLCSEKELLLGYELTQDSLLTQLNLMDYLSYYLNYLIKKLKKLSSWLRV